MYLPNKFSSLGLIGVAVAAALTAMPAQAQEQTEPEDVDEVVVTARKRNEASTDVPVTMSVFTREDITAAGIEKPGDFIARVPNMTLVETQNAGNAFVVVRGISQARNSEPSVAVLVDGVLETNPAEFNQELFDIEQIEVLKGPQGALTGATPSAARSSSGREIRAMSSKGASSWVLAMVRRSVCRRE